MKRRPEAAKTTILLGTYCLFLIWIILFKMSTFSEIPNLDRIRNINLIPFHYDVERDYHLSEVGNNIAVFVPLGVYLKMLKLRSRNAIAVGAAFSLALETMQFILGIGATDITDVITNALGTTIGVGIYCALAFVFRNKENLDKTLRILASVCTVLLFAFSATLVLFAG